MSALPLTGLTLPIVSGHPDRLALSSARMGEV
jgi:hypothetical protein